MNPRLDVVVRVFTVVDAMLKTLAESGQLDPDEYRQVVNSHQCVYHTKRLAWQWMLITRRSMKN